MPAAAAATTFLKRHGMIDVAALHVLTTESGRSWDVGVGACGTQAKSTIAGEICVGQAEGGGHRDCQGKPLHGGSGDCACGHGELDDRPHIPVLWRVQMKCCLVHDCA